jgi:antitoxin (DNA-binding transcriptional repressor) of toxin-antitoxin stability system
LSELIDRVQQGEVIAITRRGKVVAQLGLPGTHDSSGRAQDAVAERMACAQALRLNVDREPVAMRVVDDLAALHALSACDAAYLELALRRNLPLATLDDALLKAMTATGVVRAELQAVPG